MIEVRISRYLFTSPQRRWCIDATPKSQAKALYTGFGYTFREALTNFRKNGRDAGLRPWEKERAKTFNLRHCVLAASPRNMLSGVANWRNRAS